MYYEFIYDYWLFNIIFKILYTIYCNIILSNICDFIPENLSPQEITLLFLLCVHLFFFQFLIYNIIIMSPFNPTLSIHNLFYHDAWSM